MATYFVVNAPSNLIVGVLTTSYIPANTTLKTFVLSNDKSLDIYYRHLRKDTETLLDIGELMAKSGFLNDQVCKGRKGTAKPKIQRLRDEVAAKPLRREEQIERWVRSHPDSNSYDLHYEFCTGIVAARAYIDKYRY